MKILLIPSFSSDELLLSTPIIRVLKNQMDVEIHLITKKDFKSLFQENEYIANVYSLEEMSKANSSYDIVIDLQNDRQTRKIGKRLANRQYSFKHNKLHEWLFTRFRINRLQKTHLTDRYFELLRPLNIKNDEQGLEYFMSDKDEVEKEWLPETHQNGYAVLAINSKTKTQQLTTKRMIELCDRINKPIILIGDKIDAATANEIETFFKRGTDREEKEIEDLNKKAIIFNACDKFNLNQMASIIHRSNWVFTHENMFMQIAAAFKKPVFSIWGSSSPHFGKYPYKTKFTIFENNRLSCRPCSSTGFDQCPKDHFKCMSEVVFDFYLPD
ncbi:MAG: glycosyl transferase [Ekhidna sp.]|nr:glycosyl transferase [Ekhidna sp.]